MSHKTQQIDRITTTFIVSETHRNQKGSIQMPLFCSIHDTDSMLLSQYTKDVYLNETNRERESV